MMFDFHLSEDLRIKIRKLLKKDKRKVDIINKKIKEIIDNDIKSIDKYKNLRYELKHLKRVYIDRHFVLVFKINKENNEIIFEDFDHHDNVYGRIK